MKKGLHSMLLFVALMFIVNTQTLAQKESSVSIIEHNESMDEKAKKFASLLKEHINLDDNQEILIIQLRKIYLAELEKIQADESLTMNQKRAEADSIQKDYDEQFSTILTAEQKFKIRKYFLASK